MTEVQILVENAASDVQAVQCVFVESSESTLAAIRRLIEGDSLDVPSDFVFLSKTGASLSRTQEERIPVSIYEGAQLRIKKFAEKREPPASLYTPEVGDSKQARMAAATPQSQEDLVKQELMREVELILKTTRNVGIYKQQADPAAATGSVPVAAVSNGKSAAGGSVAQAAASVQSEEDAEEEEFAAIVLEDRTQSPPLQDDLNLLSLAKGEFYKNRDIVVKYKDMESTKAESTVRSLLTKFSVDVEAVMNQEKIRIILANASDTENVYQHLEKVTGVGKPLLDVCLSPVVNLLCVSQLPFENFGDAELYNSAANAIKHMKKIESDKVADCIGTCFVLRSELSGKSKGYGFITITDNLADPEIQDVCTSLNKMRTKITSFKCRRMTASEIHRMVFGLSSGKGPELEVAREKLLYKHLHSFIVIAEFVPNHWSNEIARRHFSKVHDPLTCDVADRNIHGNRVQGKRGESDVSKIAIVHFCSSTESEEACRVMNRQKFEGRRIRVTFAMPGFRPSEICRPVHSSMLRKLPEHVTTVTPRNYY